MIVIRSEYCPQNHHCPSLRVCPVGAIKQEGVRVPYIDRNKCTDCGLCAQSCRVFQQVETPSPVKK